MSLIKSVRAVVTGDYSDNVKVWQDFLTLIGELPGVTTINSIKHEFPGGGFSGLVLIAESHAAIHTWPEQDKAWIELATCGDPVAIDLFVNRWVDMTGGEPELVTE
jgi:S-adenosylmethionine/arginine decarboxylase-like enzyme